MAWFGLLRQVGDPVACIFPLLSPAPWPEPGTAGCIGRNLLICRYSGCSVAIQACNVQLGVEPGDGFEIKLGRKQIKLIPLGAAEEES